MKNKLFLLFLSFLLCLSISCHKEKPADDTPAPISGSVLDKIKALGFSINEIRRFKDGYLVENDILLYEHDLERLTSGTTLSIAATEQYRTTNLISGNSRVITIRLINLPPSYIPAVDEMIYNYNQLGLRITFQRVTAPPADITIEGKCLSGLPSPATSGFPSGGNPYPSIIVNTCAPGYDPAACYNTKVLTHEIAHCIGMRHSDWMNPIYSCGVGNPEGNGTGAIHIPGTPSAPDAGSVFLACYPKDCKSFTENDVIALRYLYAQFGGTGAYIQFAPVAISRAPDKMDVFSNSTGTALMYRSWTSPGPWATGINLAGTLSDAPAAVSMSSDKMDVFARGTNGNLIHRSWTGPGTWGAWEDLGGPISTPPAAVSRGAGILQVFAMRADFHLISRSWASGTGWSAWEDLGGTIYSQPVAVATDASNIHVFARSTSTTLVHRHWKAGTGWAAWADLGGNLAGTPAVVKRGSQWLDVFARTGDKLVHIRRNEGTGWTTWTDIPGPIGGDPVAVARDADNIHLFARGGKNFNRLFHLSWSSTNGFGGWQNLGGYVNISAAAVSRTPQSVNVFVNSASSLQTISWLNGGGWSVWSPIP